MEDNDNQDRVNNRSIELLDENEDHHHDDKTANNIEVTEEIERENSFETFVNKKKADMKDFLGVRNIVTEENSAKETEPVNRNPNPKVNSRVKAFERLADSPLYTSENHTETNAEGHEENPSDLVAKPNRLAKLNRLSFMYPKSTSKNNASSSAAYPLNPSNARNVENSENFYSNIFRNMNKNSFLVNDEENFNTNSNAITSTFSNKDSYSSYAAKLLETYEAYSNSANNFANTSSSGISYLDLNSSESMNMVSHIKNFKSNIKNYEVEPKDGLFAKKIKSMFMYIHNSYKKNDKNFDVSKTTNKIKIGNVDEIDADDFNEANFIDYPNKNKSNFYYPDKMSNFFPKKKEKKFETPHTLEIINNFDDLRKKSKTNYNNIISGCVKTPISNAASVLVNDKPKSNLSNSRNLNLTSNIQMNSSFNTSKSFKIDEINKIISKMAL
jgi:hypothetical protein